MTQSDLTAQLQEAPKFTAVMETTRFKLKVAATLSAVVAAMTKLTLVIAEMVA